MISKNEIGQSLKVNVKNIHETDRPIYLGFFVKADSYVAGDRIRSENGL